MNDFTKEELEQFKSNILNIRIYTEIENYDEDLLEKIQSMIDNYCKHENDVWPLYTAHGDFAVGAICYDCNKVIDKEYLK